MLIHGRLTVTQNSLMLDEVRSLLQKSLRRQETDLALRATRELIGPQKDRLPWKSIVTFIFEDHCLTHADLLFKLYRLFQQKDKFKSIELLTKLYTCRHAACLQVVAIGDRFRPDEKVWKKDLPVSPEMKGLLTQGSGRSIDCDILLSLIVKNWQEKNVEALITLFGLVNMSEKIEKRSLTKAGKTFLIGFDVKKPSLYHLVLSLLYKNSTDGYMKRIALICFKFATIDDVPKGLIMFTVLSQMMFKDIILQKPQPDVGELGKIDWRNIPKLEKMPDWAVDKHTFRGKFGKGSEHVFKKQIKHNPFSEDDFREFHGERPKADIRKFFDVGCVCTNDILAANPIWEEAKEMYLKQKPSQQKCHKMTILNYHEMKKKKNVVFGTSLSDHYTDSDEAKVPPVKKRKSDKAVSDTPRKRPKLESEASTSGLKIEHSKEWPLLQLPTGSGKVYTLLDMATHSVWKGPYHTKGRQNLCVFYHKAMKEVFNDKHTLKLEEKQRYLVFPLVKHEDAKVEIVHRGFYDCIARKDVPESEGKFVERSSLGIVQLHKIKVQQVVDIPLSVWGHFAFRFALNIGDTGLYNAIATRDLDIIYGIDMEERRNQVKGNDVMNMLFGKLPRKEIAAEILNVLRKNKSEFSTLVSGPFDYPKVDALCKVYGVENLGDICKNRLAQLTRAIEDL